MAVCKYCQLEMNGADGCVKLPVKTKDGDFDPVLYGRESWYSVPKLDLSHSGVPPKVPPRCHDCDALPEHYHHVGCDMEECPRCHEQLIGRDCDPDAIPSSTVEAAAEQVNLEED